FTTDGRLLVAIRDKQQVQVFEPTAKPEAGALEGRCSLPTDAEPVGLAMAPDDSQLYVSTRWGHSLALYDAKAATMARAASVPLPRRAGSVGTSDDGHPAFVSHAVGGATSAVDPDNKRVLSMPLHPTDELLKMQQERRKKKEKADGAKLPDVPSQRFSRG